MFQVGQIVVVRSSGIRRKIETVAGDLYETSSGSHRRVMKGSALCTVEEYKVIWEAREAKRRKKFGRR